MWSRGLQLVVGAMLLRRSLLTTLCFGLAACAADAEQQHENGMSEADAVRAEPSRACEKDSPVNALLRQTIAKAGRSLCELGQRNGDLDTVYPPAIARDPFRTKIFDRLYYEPAAIPVEGKAIADAVKVASTSGRYASDVVRVAARLWDVDDATIPQPTLSTSKTFDQAIAAFTPSSEQHEQAQLLPTKLRDDLALVLVALRTAIDLRNQAIPAGTDLERWFRAPMGMFSQMNNVVSAQDKIDITRAGDRSFLVDGFRYDKMAEAAIVLSSAVEQSNLRGASYAGSYSFNVATPFGRIVIRGTDNDTYRADDPALAGDLLFVFDAGGDDRYEVALGATQSPNNPVSLAIDLGGADVYTYVKTPQNINERPDPDAAGRRPSPPRYSLSEVRRQGSGTLGVGMLFDFGSGDDQYESLRFSQGSGILGVGVLYDEGGNDRYDAEAVVQGGAQFGVGLLIDRAGNDRYHAYSVAQGGSHVKAVGMLVDYEGNDTYWTSPGNTYLADDFRIAGHDYFYDYGISQGASWGRRGDYPIDGLRNEGHASGGVGALFDLGGADKYTCGAFCQGTGYWFGTGLFWDDGAENDESYARVFAAGSGIHFGVGAYHDGGGDDRHHVGAKPEGLTFGSGDDLSLGYFEDLSGNDEYNGGRHSFGSGTEKGVGIFVDVSGNDRYASSRGDGYGSIIDPSDMQSPTNKRHKLASMGIFTDGAGVDTYKRTNAFTPDPIGDSRSWLHPWVKDQLVANTPYTPSITYPAPNIFGVGLDR